MARGPHGQVNADALRQWLTEKDYRRRAFQREVLKAAQALAVRRNELPPKPESIYALVKRWDEKLENQEPLYVTDASREILEELGGETSANWFPSASAGATQNIQDENKHPPSNKRLISNSRNTQDGTRRVPNTGPVPPHGNRSREAEFDEIFKDDYPKDVYEDDFNRAIGASFTGTNLRRIVKEDEKLDHLKHLLDRITSKKALLSNDDCDVKVLMHHPKCDDELCRLGRMQDEGRDSGNLDSYRAHLHINLSVFCLLRAKYGNKVKIRTMKYMPAFGLDLYRYTPTGGACYVRMYPLPDPDVDNKDKPTFRLTHRDGYWYTEFKKQFDRHWNAVSTDLQDKYPWETGIDKIKGDFSEELQELLKDVLGSRTLRQSRR
jgi:hypothetical protein